MTDIVGLDLSIQSTGIANHEGTHTIRPTTQGDQRLVEIVDKVIPGWIRAAPTPITLVAIEDLPRGHNPAAATLGMLHGAIRIELIRQDVPYLLVPPATLKTYATGRGNATKPDMRMSLYQRMGLDLACDDECDAAWLRLLAYDLAGDPILVLPATHRRALNKLTLPT